MKKIAFILACIMLLASFATFSAFADNDIVTVTFRTSDGSKLFLDAGERVSEKVYTYNKGHVMESRDIPRLNIPTPCYFKYEWDVEPVGTVLNEDTVFTLVITSITETHTVRFYDWDDNLIKTEQVEHGHAATPPELEDKDGMMAVDWYSKPIDLGNGGGIDLGHYPEVYNDLDCYPVSALRGDANDNDMLDVGDATLILRASLEFKDWWFNMYPSYRVYDFNKNNSIDAGDATGVLRSTVGLK